LKIAFHKSKKDLQQIVQNSITTQTPQTPQTP